jgi:hypothetical protein
MHDEVREDDYQHSGNQPECNMREAQVDYQAISLAGAAPLFFVFFSCFASALAGSLCELCFSLLNAKAEHLSFIVKKKVSANSWAGIHKPWS